MIVLNTQNTPGNCVLLGSGETTRIGRRALNTLLQKLDEPREIAVLDTPAGFQPNHRQVAEKIVHFLVDQLAECRPRPCLIETRRGAHGTEKEVAALAVLSRARCIVAGPGSPTYMIRELANTLIWDVIRRAHANGTAIYMSSAASIALSAFSLPVYEIFKVGEDLHWKTGLDLFGPFGMPLAIIPHWNNQEGGASVDTRFCYMGEERFKHLLRQLPTEVIILGLDEHTACTLDFVTACVSIEGKGRIHIVRDGEFMEWSSGETFPLSLLEAQGSAVPRSADLPIIPVSLPLETPLAEMLIPRIQEGASVSSLPPQLIEAVLSVRMDLRSRKHWEWADQLRDALVACGIAVEDTPTGSQWHVIDGD